MKALKLTLSAPLQYYSKPSIATYGTMQTVYPTETHPTRSAICGLLGCALGYQRGDMRLRNDSQIKFYWRTECGNRTIITDFQTIRPLHSKQRFKTIDGKTKSEALIKYIQYIADTEFSVYIVASEEQLQAFHYALQHPKWACSLGRKCCVPTKPLVSYNFQLEDIPDDADVCF